MTTITFDDLQIPKGKTHFKNAVQFVAFLREYDLFPQDNLVEIEEWNDSELPPAMLQKMKEAKQAPLSKFTNL